MNDQEANKDDARRHRELFRYMLPVDLIPHEVLPVNEANAFSRSIHSALQPHCQLTALRCGVPKVMLNVMDGDKMYFLSQASLGPDGFDHEGDPVLQACSAAVPLTGRVCEMTIRMTHDSDTLPMFTVPNLAESAFKDLSVVAGPPFYRFYAGTPITTASGVNIGSLAVLDSRPRQALTVAQEAFLGRTASQIMDVFETRRDAWEGRRAVYLGRSLEAFAAGKTTMKTSRFEGTADSAASETSWHERPKARSKSVVDEQITNPTVDEDPDAHSEVASANPVLLGQSVAQTVRRAADLLREAFSDASDEIKVSFVNLKARNVSAERTEDRMSEDLSYQHQPPSINRQVTALASSPSQFEPELSSDFVMALVQRYPNGCLFDLDEPYCYSPMAEDDHGQSWLSSKYNRLPTSGERSRINVLRDAYPDAHQLLFTPLWDSDHASFTYAAFVVSSAETAFLSTGTDLSFLNAFCASLMTECSRIEAAKSQKQKSDFVGTMSHEMRSPLHGILASVEFLSETVLDTYQQSLVDTVQSCGRTLLDTINHVLDFSKINTYRKTWQVSNHRTKGLQKRLSRQPDAAAPALLQITDVTHVAAVVEEVIDTLVTGRDFVSSVEPVEFELKRRLRRSEHPVQVLLDIDNANWTFLTQPGAIRRIVINLAGNAMKYTSKGSVRVQLRQLVVDDVTDVILTVTDTGCGISQQFIDTKLFRPFSQENALAPGTGLGLSIVQNIITMMNGTITVSSEVGKGTSFQVRLPMERPAPGQTSTQTTPSSGSTTSSLRSNPQLMIEQLASQASHRRARVSVKDPELKAIVLKSVTSWYNMEVVFGDADIYIVDEFGSPGMTKNDGVTLFLGSASQRHAWTGNDRKIEFVAVPVGPYRLARSIQAALSRQRGSTRGSVDLDTIPEQVSVKALRDSLREIDLNDGSDGGLSRIVHGTESMSIAQDSLEAFNAISPRQEVTGSKDGGFPFGRQTGATQTQVHLIQHSINHDGSSLHARPRVLVVDDNQINLTLLKNFLMRKRSYHEVDLAQDGQQALDKFTTARQPYDIVFMDLSMPIMNGFESTRGIRKFEVDRGPDSNGALIVALTGLAGGRDQAEAFESGVDIYLTKPVSFKLVAEMLDNWEANTRASKRDHEQLAKEQLESSVHRIQSEEATGALTGMDSL